MANDRITAYATAMLGVARAEGQLDTVVDELHAVAQALRANDELRNTLTDRRIEAARRSQIVEDLLGGNATDTTTALVSMAVSTGRAGDLPDIIGEVIQLGAKQANRKVAFVRSAVALTDDQKQRLAAALTKSTGEPVDVLVTVDPNVIGGIVTEIGDTVIDGSVRSRLAQLKDAF